MLGKLIGTLLLGGTVASGGVVVTDNDLISNIQEKVFEFRSSLTEEEKAQIQEKRNELRETYLTGFRDMNPLERFEAKYQLSKELRDYMEVEMGIDLPFAHCSDWLESQTEENQALIMAKYEELTSVYDWDNLTRDEVIDAKETIKLELEAFIVELGIELPEEYELFMGGFRHRDRFGHFMNRNYTQEELDALREFKDSLVSNYDWETMTDEEKAVAKEEIMTALQEYAEAHDLELPSPREIRHRRRHGRMHFGDGQ